ncbi:hypothetical protein KP509_22G009800 [Ceratopteris richardii]|uniref:Pentatricopeptide repeat-containing protein n=1 Tax=Ceratopteris richardii TaxID=49495 RepID=A0A8T2S2L2_CERRI|nr:hypothetical protein KP509_22G009800 [Ceratopteris richardii]
MQEDAFLSLNNHALLPLLKKCIRLKDVETGNRLHTLIFSKGLLKTDIVVGSALVDFHFKCGALSKAEEVFWQIRKRDVVLWTTMIGGYAEHGRAEDALQCLSQMRHDGFSPNAYTLVCSSKACARLKSANRGQEIHTEITMKGFESEVLVSNSLMSMYASCGLLDTARMIFDRLSARDVVSWTVIIDAYAEHGCAEKAIGCLEHMQLENISPNVLTLTCGVKACASTGAIEMGHRLHSNIIEGGFESSLAAMSSLVTMYVKFGMLPEAQFIFDKLGIRDAILWTALLAGYCQVGESENVFAYFDKMLQEGVRPVPGTFIILLNACNHEGLVEKGLECFQYFGKYYGLTLTMEYYSTVVDLLGRSGHVSKGLSMIEAMPWHPDYILWCTILRACCKWQNMEVARYAFEHAIRLNRKCLTAYVFMSNICANAYMHSEANGIEMLGVQNGACQNLTDKILEFEALFCLDIPNGYEPKIK